METVATAAADLRAGDTVNVGTAAAPQWARIERVEYSHHVGGRAPYSHHAGGRAGGADIYRVWWTGAEESAAPSLLSSRELYDVVKQRAHLAASACHVCGATLEQHGASAGHKFWSNADAARELASGGQASGSDGGQAARYVEQYRPR